ncbi:hypothetical protein LTR70_008139 [Exophiala xenobiotica]|uniref:Intradiol ring-cleavage dioxygenases domain-containing protein n=1 Tax=Lithohypha guttulata TaxID=1690604 RepID=A0ABR0JY87_9EURO|nr:hypothetical protein LTR24_009261 [Lithohypha guttulata]KAK5312541.1 hypothetical protein LTR70_008139 [Exophiala xenobiotica]
MKVGVFTSTLTLAILSSSGVAHPGEHHDHLQIKREGKRALAKCENSPKHRDLSARSAKRRAETVQELRTERNIKSRARKWKDLATLEAYEAVDHNKTAVYTYDSTTPEATVFAANSSCILTPEVTDGPYYVFGEAIRKNVKEDMYSDGVDLYLEVQYLDINTCEPVPDVAVDIWNANATGVYSGISVSGNYAADGYNSTYLRGIQFTGADGVASFETIFPGHYEGRATHTHLLAYMNAVVNANETITNGTGTVTHIHQLFRNEVLKAEVEATYPYNTNEQPITTNEEDMWSIVQAENDYDPFPEYLYLGDDVSDGLFGWIQIAINTTQDMSTDLYYAVAAYIDTDGVHVETDSLMGGGNGTAPNMTAPAAPSSTARAVNSTVEAESCSEFR